MANPTPELPTHDATEENVTLTLPDGTAYEMPIMAPTHGPKVINVSRLFRDTGYFTYDPGFLSTASCDSQLTFIDGGRGVLLHRGYSIEDLAAKASHVELAYLLLYDKLPNKSELDKFRQTITYHTMVHEQFKRFFEGYRRDAHPMALMVGTVGALSAFYHEDLDITDATARETATHRIVAKMPTICAMAYKYSIGQPFVYPRNDLDYAGNFLHMCFSVPAEEYKVSPVLARAMNRFLVLHADHEQNASTATVRLAGSSQANPYACIAAGCASLWGPAHGGANEACLRMLMEIGSKDRIPEYIKKAKDKSDPFRLMGFGHRVVQKLRPPGPSAAGVLPRGPRGARQGRPAPLRTGDGAREDRARRRVLQEQAAVPQRRLLLGHHAPRDGLPHEHVPGAVRPRPHGRVDLPVERDDRRAQPAHRATPPALHREPGAPLRRP